MFKAMGLHKITYGESLYKEKVLNTATFGVQTRRGVAKNPKEKQPGESEGKQRSVGPRSYVKKNVQKKRMTNCVK